MMGDLKLPIEDYQYIFINSNDGIYILFKDKFVRSNPSFQKMFGYLEDELKHIDFSFKQLIAPESIGLINRRQEHYKNGMPLPSQYKFTALHKDGHKIPVETNVKYFDVNGNKSTLGIVRDISTRRKFDILELKNFLREKSGTFEEILESLFLKLFVSSNFYGGSVFTFPNGKIKYLPILKIPKDKELNIYNFPRKILGDALDGKEKRINENENHTDYVEILKFNKNIKDTICLPIITNGKVIGGVCICENDEYKMDEFAVELYRIACSDLSSIHESLIRDENIKKNQIEIKKINKQLKETNEKKEKLIDDLKHEIITPINAIMGHASYVRELYKDLDDEMKKLKLKDIVSESERLQEIFNDIEGLALLNVGTPSQVNLFDAIIHKQVAIFRDRLSEKGIKIKFERKIFLPMLNIDSSKFDLIVSNLLRNIYKYSYPNTDAIIRVDFGDNFYFHLDFINYGYKIPLSEEEMIFDEGYRSSNVRSVEPSITGSGIGLHLVKQFLQKHHSRIKVISNFNPIIFRIFLSRSLIFSEKKK